MAGELATGTGFPKVFYLNYHYYRLYFPLMALARRSSRAGPPRQGPAANRQHASLNWTLKSPPATCAIPPLSHAQSQAAAWSFTSPPITACGRRIPVRCTKRMWTAFATCWLRHNPRVLTGLSTPARSDASGCPTMELATKPSHVRSQQMAGDYKRSKFLGEQVALEFARKGFPVVIVNPTAPMGDHDFKPTPTGQIVVDFLRGAMPAFIDTGLNVVGVKDVANGHLLACERGKAGERYILGSENLTLRRILQDLADISGQKAPTTEIPYFVAWMAGAAGTALSRITGKPPRVALEAVRMARKKVWVSHEKAARELGYSPRPAREALEDAVAWFNSRPV
jgi:nucleoside-diphosphate-sugar epimerase